MSYRKDIDAMKSNKEEILQNWKTTCVDLDSLPSKIAQLREEQHSYAEQEDFDKACLLYTSPSPRDS